MIESHSGRAKIPPRHVGKLIWENIKLPLVVLTLTLLMTLLLHSTGFSSCNQGFAFCEVLSIWKNLLLGQPYHTGRMCDERNWSVNEWSVMSGQLMRMCRRKKLECEWLMCYVRSNNESSLLALSPTLSSGFYFIFLNYRLETDPVNFHGNHIQSSGPILRHSHTCTSN